MDKIRIHVFNIKIEKFDIRRGEYCQKDEKNCNYESIEINKSNKSILLVGIFFKLEIKGFIKATVFQYLSGPTEKYRVSAACTA